MTYLIVAGLLAIIASLAAAGFFMLRGGKEGESKSKRMARALTLRIGISVALFICILVAWQLGYLRPTGIPLR